MSNDTPDKVQKAKAKGPILRIETAGDIPEHKLGEEDFRDGVVDLIQILASSGLVASRSEGRRAIEQGGVTVNDEKIVDVKKTYTKDDFASDFVVRRGKKNFKKIVL